MLQTARLDLVLLEPAEARGLADGINRDGHRWATGYPLGSTLLRAELTVAAAAQERPLGGFGNYQVVCRADDQVIGDVGFMGPPDATGAVNVGCAIIEDALELEAGVLGVSGVSADMREVRAAAERGNERAALALRMFAARAAEGIAAALTWVRADAIVFTGGIGEHDAEMRDQILERIPTTEPPPRVLVVAAQEEVVMAQAATTLLAAG